MDHAATATAGHAQGQQHQQHPIGLYLTVWGFLFVLSTFSYLVDYFHFQGLLRWSLILLIFAILLPPGAILVLVGLMAAEGDYTFFTRGLFFGH
ncbi:MAG: cytochrome C oxidase subunit IV [Betaproteobacteria bacterium]|nr:MAG: cytochrome C oxidase subunit IV [Betaproteobacteria bacterium]